MRANRRLLLRGGIIAAVLAALVWTVTLAAAQAPAAATRLEPGINLIGWIGEATPVSQLFREIDGLNEIWAWDAELGQWLVAGRYAPDGLGGLRSVTAGMGLRLRLDRDRPFTWLRPTQPTRGLVRLRTGWNLVAWSGADGTPIEDAVKGIGWSLRSVRRWDAANQQWQTWTSPERSAQLIAGVSPGWGSPAGAPSLRRGVRRGEALWINVSRAVNWLQPTNVLPRLVFPGGASHQLQERVRSDLEVVLSFFRTQYGIQADPEFTIYVATDAEALIQAFRDDGEQLDDADSASIRALWNRAGGWAGERIVVKQSSWPDDLSTSEIALGRDTLMHEYFHVLQRHLSDSWAPSWLTEGTARWVEGEYAVIHGSRTRQDIRESQWSLVTNETPSLRSTERDNATWEYTLGSLAVDLLTTVSGPGAWLEFWRRLLPTEIGPHGRWISTLDWRSAFQDVFGITVSRFYTDYFYLSRRGVLMTREWQQQQAAARLPPPDYTPDLPPDTTREIRGQVTAGDGSPVAGAFVNAIRTEEGTDVGRIRRTETAADGTFAIRVSQNGDYRISVDINDDCTYYYSNGDLTVTEDGQSLTGVAQLPRVFGPGSRHLDIGLPHGVCGWFIRGQVVDAGGGPLAGVLVTACPTFGACSQKRTALDGQFSVPVAGFDMYHLRVGLKDTRCEVYYNGHTATFSEGYASRISVLGADVSGITVEVPTDLCRRRVIGRMTQDDGRPLADVEIVACRETGGGCFPLRPREGYPAVEALQCVSANSDCTIVSAITDDDGSFAIAVPVEGGYSLGFKLHGCPIYLRDGGFTTSFDGRSIVLAGGRDVRLNLPPVPADICWRP